MAQTKEVNTALAVTEAQFIEEPLTYTEEQVELIKNSYAKGASDAELRLFIEVAERKGLDIFSRQIFLIERWDSKVKGYVRTPETSVDGYRVIADRTGLYVPGDEPTFTYDDNGKLRTATAYVKKYVQGVWHVITATAHWAEYVATTKEGQVNTMWRTKPHVMLAKCAEALALRKAFPAQLSGLYTREEMEQANNVRPEEQPKQQQVAPQGAIIEGEIIETPPLQPMPVAKAAVVSKRNGYLSEADADRELARLKMKLTNDLGMERPELIALIREVTMKGSKETLTVAEKNSLVGKLRDAVAALEEKHQMNHAIEGNDEPPF